MRPEESFVGQPVRSVQTMLRVIAIDDTSIPSVIPDGIYGPETMQAVTAFQRKYGLPQTGITNQITWEKILSVYDTALVQVGKATPIEIVMEPGVVFQLGDSNPYLYLLQSMLTVLSKEHGNLLAPPISGVWDQETAISVAAFQELSGLPQTGELDRVTWQNLSMQFTMSAVHQNRF